MIWRTEAYINRGSVSPVTCVNCTANSSQSMSVNHWDKMWRLMHSKYINDTCVIHKRHPNLSKRNTLKLIWKEKYSHIKRCKAITWHHGCSFMLSEECPGCLHHNTTPSFCLFTIIADTNMQTCSSINTALDWLNHQEVWLGNSLIVRIPLLEKHNASNCTVDTFTSCSPVRPCFFPFFHFDQFHNSEFNFLHLFISAVLTVASSSSSPPA